MNLVQFADDTIILCSGNSIKDLRISMLETLEKVHEYLNENKLVLFVIKTEFFVSGDLFKEKKQNPQRNMPGILELK